MLFSLFGCSRNDKLPVDELSYISLTQNHMNSANCYSFSAYKNDNTYMFSAWCVIDSVSVDLENAVISDDEFEYFRELDKKYDFVLNQKSDKNRKNTALDATTRSFKVSYGLEEFKLKTDSECYDEVYDYFISLAKKYNRMGESENGFIRYVC